MIEGADGADSLNLYTMSGTQLILSYASSDAAVDIEMTATGGVFSGGDAAGDTLSVSNTGGTGRVAGLIGSTHDDVLDAGDAPVVQKTIGTTK